MSKNPFVNALAASLYIITIGLVMNFASTHVPKDNPPLGVIALISLFTLSAAVMGYLFCYQPAQLYFEGKKKDAVRLFLHTVSVFALITVILFGFLFIA
jgi:uncharacterized membrane-anchored protein